MADRVGHALPDHPAEQLPPPGRHLVDRAGQGGGDAGRAEHLPRGGQLHRRARPRDSRPTAARTSASTCRVSRSTSPISAAALTPPSWPTSRPASCALTEAAVSECPSRSCRSRAIPHPLPLGGEPVPPLLGRPQLPGPPDQRLEPERGQRAERDRPRHRPGVGCQPRTARSGTPARPAGCRPPRPAPRPGTAGARDRRPSRSTTVPSASGPTRAARASDSARAGPARPTAATAAHRSSPGRPGRRRRSRTPTSRASRSTRSTPLCSVHALANPGSR